MDRLDASCRHLPTSAQPEHKDHDEQDDDPYPQGAARERAALGEGHGKGTAPRPRRAWRKEIGPITTGAYGRVAEAICDIEGASSEHARRELHRRAARCLGGPKLSAGLQPHCRLVVATDRMNPPPERLC
jgi:hypothetical protein